VIDGSGKVIVSSSGFDVSSDSSMPDYTDAINSKLERGEWTGRLDSGEKVMAMSSMITLSDGQQHGAVRYIISLEDIDNQLFLVVFLIVLGCIFALLLVVTSGMFFIRSIIKPIRNISTTAKLIAGGDLDARIDNYLHKDEIGELCETINHMAGELSESEKIKNDFISTISHELRTPLTAIKGWGETLLQVGDTDAALTKRGMGVIISEVSRLSGIVEELLDFSRMQSGRMNLRIEKIDVLAELDETVFTFKERAVSDGIEMIYNAPHIPTPMDADADRIRQVFINILDNALKYTEQGGKITVFAELENPTRLNISISDTGCGIPTEYLPKVKEKFYKINNSVRGSGIGLAVADEIVKLHGGILSIDSILGEGTTVTVTLPVDEVVFEEERGFLNEE
jgi:signal transduction histidine kinase